MNQPVRIDELGMPALVPRGRALLVLARRGGGPGRAQAELRLIPISRVDSTPTPAAAPRRAARGHLRAGCDRSPGHYQLMSRRPRATAALTSVATNAGCILWYLT